MCAKNCKITLKFAKSYSGKTVGPFFPNTVYIYLLTEML